VWEKQLEGKKGVLEFVSGTLSLHFLMLARKPIALSLRSYSTRAFTKQPYPRILFAAPFIASALVVNATFSRPFSNSSRKFPSQTKFHTLDINLGY